MSEEFGLSSGMPSDEMAQYLQMFVDETSEQLDALVEVLLVLETDPSSQSNLNESFRLIHSIKGAAAMMGLDSITLLTHHLENYFERLRSGVQSLDRPMMELILRCVDFLRDATIKLRDGQPLVSSPDLLEALSNRELATEKAFAIKQTPPSVSAPSLSTQRESVSHTRESIDERNDRDKSPIIEKRLIVYFDREIELPELKAELILARLTELSDIQRTSPSREDLGSIVELRTLQIWVQTARSDDELRSVADVVGVELLEIDLVTRTDDVPTFEIEDDDLSKDGVAINHDKPSVHIAHERSPAEAAESLSKRNPELQVAAVREAPMPSQVPSGGQSFQPASNLASAPFRAKQEPETQTKVAETVRVDIQRLDKLMNLAGELVVNRARFVRLADQMKETFKKSGLLGHLRELCDGLRANVLANEGFSASESPLFASEDKRLELFLNIEALEDQLQVLERGRRSFVQLNEAIDQFSRVSDGIQRGVLDTRMVPVGPLFNRFKRTVRDIAVELGKTVIFEIHGENTELDKRMIDELGDPLVHLVRNAIDHGLESEAVRRSRGKPEAGTLTLEAVHSGNTVLIYIRDDGGGINVEKVKQRALQRGLVSQAELQNMTDREIAQFIWAPGFSTAEVVSDISGRGVGMDIVKTRIRELNGTIEVDTTLGQGTTFIIRLPLTLAIIRSLLFQLDHGIFATPIENVREIVSVRSSEVISVHGRNSIEVRGEFIPLLTIKDIFDWHETRYDYDQNPSIAAALEGDRSSVIVLATVNKKIGLFVSELKGCEDLVVKSLDENFTHIRGLAGASILGDGSVCLLLDIVSCVDLAHERLRDRKRFVQRPSATAK